MEAVAAVPGRCPRHARAAAAPPKDVGNRVRLTDLWSEPFRLFFPLAALAGLVGVGYWPLMLKGWIDFFPNIIHARLMVPGFFGGFVIGFLATSIPRLLEAPRLRAVEVLLLWTMHAGLVGAYAFNHVALGDRLAAGNVILLLVVLGLRVGRRKDLPAPGFVMILPGLFCLLAGLVIAEADRRTPLEGEFDLLFRLLAYHGYPLLCILGAGSFLLPRFLGVGVRRRFADGPRPDRAWLLGAVITIVAGFTVMASYGLDVYVDTRLGGTIRALAVTGYLCWEIPVERLRWSGRGVQWFLLVGIIALPVGILAAGWRPGLRVALGHIELITGFSFITLAVATRVVFGHSGNREKLERFHPWITFAGVLILLSVPTRIAGEIWPQLMLTHYLYGAVGFLAGLAIWMGCALPKVLRPDPEG